MQRLLLVIATAAGVGAVATWADLPSGATVIELGQGELGQSLAAGVILGSNVWPYAAASPATLDLTAALLRSPDCDTPGQCGMYGLASATFTGSQPDTPDTLDTE